MAFGAPNDGFKIDSGKIKGIRKHIACLSWFPNEQEPYPISFKFK